MQQPPNVDGCLTQRKDTYYGDEKTFYTSPSSTAVSESPFFDSFMVSDFCPPGMKKIRRLSAGSRLSSYYYIGPELRVCADNKKSSSRPVLRDIIDRRTGEPKVLKIISKSRLPPGPGGLQNWRALCEKLMNLELSPNLMRIEQVWESDTSFYIVTEKLMGGELFEFLLSEKAIPEDICKYIMKQIFHAVEHLHNRNLLHRDIKPENIMFRNSFSSSLPVPDGYELVLIDFDTCKMTDKANVEKIEIVNGKRRLVGTYGYLAPEILRGEEYTTASDMWSIGIVLYILMTGVPPVSMEKMYDAKASHAVLSAAETNGIDFNMPPLVEFPLARDLCRRLLCFDRHKRIASATDALAHPWLVGLPSIFDRRLRMKSPHVGNSQDRNRGHMDSTSGGGHFRGFFPRTLQKDSNKDAGAKYGGARKAPLLENTIESTAKRKVRKEIDKTTRQTHLSSRSIKRGFLSVKPATYTAVVC